MNTEEQRRLGATLAGSVKAEKTRAVIADRASDYHKILSTAALELGLDDVRDRRLAGGREAGEPDDEAGHALRLVCRPHSTLSDPAQRPSRPAPGAVQWVQPIDA